MTAPEALTFDSLVTDIQSYAERSDTVFVNQVPRFIMMAENRIASEVRGLGLKQFVSGAMSINNPVMAKPARWRETQSFSYVDATGKRKYMLPRTYEYCRTFWPNVGLSAAPRYFADYDFEHFYIAAPPDIAYNFELVYFERPAPLSTLNETTWTTQYAPQLLLYASLLEAQPFLKRPERIAEFQTFYDRAAAAVTKEALIQVDAQQNPTSGVR
jgi:hypothetical protein